MREVEGVSGLCVREGGRRGWVDIGGGENEWSSGIRVLGGGLGSG